ncbi:amino acid adenylation domain-containing protein [Lentzea sp. NPDC058436]|uniref:non-ribosomal peptide synthetase n=1 Tax=Lentzea sp. NPDC058436 TaxID=3346499 RepID=UPI00365076D1
MTAGADAWATAPALTPSAGQVGIWIQDRMGAADAYNVSFAYRLDSSLDVAAVTAAVQESIGRHEVFRTVFREVGGEVAALVAADPPPLDFHRARIGPDDVGAVLESSWRTPFDLTSDRLVRVRLLDVDGDHHVLSFTVHHIVFDDWSMGVLLDELAELYRDGAPPPSPVNDGDAMAAHRSWAAARRSHASHQARLDVAAGALADAPERLDLPRRKSDSTAQRGWSGASSEAVLDEDVAAGVRAAAMKAGCTEYVLYLAAWATLVGIYAQHDDITVGTPVADRLGRGTTDLVGYFLNTLVVRQHVHAELTFTDVLEATRDAFYGAVENADVPYEDVVHALSGRRENPAAPLFSVWFALDDATSGLTLDGVAVERIAVPTTAAKFELALYVSLGATGHQLAVEYSSTLYDAAVVDGMLRHYRRLLGLVVGDPDVRVRDITVLGDDEVAALRRWERREGPRQVPGHLHAEFTATALREGERVAIEHAHTSVSYAELKAASDGIAARLRAAGVTPGTVVGVSVARSPAMVAAVLGVLATGAGYVALDPAHPASRLDHMIADSDVRVVVTDEASAGPMSAFGVVTIPAEGTGATEAVVPVAANPKDLAYVTYTSGSTGKPKGIRMSHGAVWNLLDWQRRHYASIGRGHRTLQFAALSFDVSAQEIFGALCTGGVLVLIDQHERDAVHDVMRVVRDRRVDRVFMAAPALLEAVESAVALDVVPDRLRVLVSGSEQLVVTEALRTFLTRLHPDARLFNEYGPSETHVATMYQAPADPARWPAWMPIGTPVGDTEVRLLDAHGRRTPPGSVGEICLAGPGLADGYSRLPATTARAFVPDPHGTGPGARMYRTGDLARFLPGGDLEFLGRRDSQIKIRGFRVELEEVRAVLDAAAQVAQSFVMVTARAGQNVITAFWSRVPGVAGDPWAHLHDHLPSYMVPARLVEIGEFPLTAHGKVDQRALLAAHPDDDTTGPRTTRAEPTGDPRSLAVAGAMAAVLGRESVGEHDDFFELGGHSLLANRLVWTLESEGIAAVTLRAVFDGRTAARIAALAPAAAPRRVAAAPRPESVADRLSSLIDQLGGDGPDERTS